MGNRKMGKLDVETHRKAQRALLEAAGEGHLIQPSDCRENNFFHRSE